MSIQGRVSADAPPILRLGDLPEIERRVIRLLRLWRDGPAGQTEARILAGDAACLWLEGLLRLLAAPAARPLHVAAPGFSNVLGDEAVFARAVSIELEYSPEPERIVEWVEEAYRETDRLMRKVGLRG